MRMFPAEKVVRCDWARSNLLIAYHDREPGVAPQASENLSVPEQFRNQPCVRRISLYQFLPIALNKICVIKSRRHRRTQQRVLSSLD